MAVRMLPAKRHCMYLQPSTKLLQLSNTQTILHPKAKQSASHPLQCPPSARASSRPATSLPPRPQKTIRPSTFPDTSALSLGTNSASASLSMACAQFLQCLPSPLPLPSSPVALLTQLRYVRSFGYSEDRATSFTSAFNILACVLSRNIIRTQHPPTSSHFTSSDYRRSTATCSRFSVALLRTVFGASTKQYCTSASCTASATSSMRFCPSFRQTSHFFTSARAPGVNSSNAC